MLVETSIRLLRTFATCPKCETSLTLKGLSIKLGRFSIKCDCGWCIEGYERGAEKSLAVEIEGMDIIVGEDSYKN